jgi:hypothetical protein
MLISTHRMMAEQPETYNAVTNMKKDLILNLATLAKWTGNKTATL